MTNFKNYLNEAAAMDYYEAISDIASDFVEERYSNPGKSFENKIRSMAYALGKVYNKDPMKVERQIYSSMNSIKKDRG